MNKKVTRMKRNAKRLREEKKKEWKERNQKNDVVMRRTGSQLSS
jgi:hypothetical protein